MSYDVPKEDLDQEWKSYIKRVCNIWSRATKWKKSDVITIFNVDKATNSVALPLALWKDMMDEFPNVHTSSKKDFTVEFVSTPEETEKKDQLTVLNQAQEKLNRDHFLLLALRTGFGKTMCALYLVVKYGLKAVVLCHVSTVNRQWVEEANKHCPGLKVQLVTGSKLNPKANMYVMGILKASHFTKKDFEDIKMVILDEVHITLTSTFSKALLLFKPIYLIGLSATPDRRDGMHKLLYPYFGNKNQFIVRHEVKQFTVIKLVTSFKPVIINTTDGIDWNILYHSIASNPERQTLIADICSTWFPDHKIFILTKRVCECIGCCNYDKCRFKNKEAKGVIPLLKERKESAASFIENDKTYDKDVRIVMGTIKKMGVGLNDTSRNLEILASDVIDVRQNEGRIRVDNNIIVDIVDDFALFERHWKEREKWYIKRGATFDIRHV